MKSIFLAITLLASAVSYAGEIKVYEAPAWSGDTVHASFGFNEKLGRVWVELNVSDRFDYEDDGEFLRVKVPALTYDASAQAAFLDIDGQLVECALLKQRGILVFKNNYLKATGCKFTSKTVTKMVDNGFEIRKQQYLQVFLVTKE